MEKKMWMSLRTRYHLIRVNRLLVVTILVLCMNTGLAQQGIPPRPNPPRLVNDLGNLLSPDEEQSLESKLVALDDSTSVHVAVVTVNDLDDYEKDEVT